jgi:hypothetical protein
MQPGVFSRDGFLGEDDRPLAEIIATDGSRVESMGTSHESIAGALRGAVDAAMRAGGAPVDVGPNLRAEAHEALGRIPSPFGDGMHRKGEVRITDSRTGRTLTVTPLSVHMIAAQGFYGGRGSRFRVEPEVVCEMFALGQRDSG